MMAHGTGRAAKMEISFEMPIFEDSDDAQDGENIQDDKTENRYI